MTKMLNKLMSIKIDDLTIAVSLLIILIIRTLIIHRKRINRLTKEIELLKKEKEKENE